MHESCQENNPDDGSGSDPVLENTNAATKHSNIPFKKAFKVRKAQKHLKNAWGFNSHSRKRRFSNDTLMLEDLGHVGIGNWGNEGSFALASFDAIFWVTSAKQEG